MDGAAQHRGGWSLSTLLLTAFWAALLLISSLCLAAFSFGLLRDDNPDQVRLALPEQGGGEHATVQFKVLRPGQHTLWFTALHQSGRLPPGAFGRLDYEVIAPGGGILARRTARLALDQNQSGDSVWVELDRFDLPRAGMGAYRIRSRYQPLAPSLTMPVVMLRKQQQDVGMGGLINYVLALPAIVLGLLSVGVGFPVWRRTGIPFWLAPMALLAAAMMGGPAWFYLGS